jgi:hypothetical protein
MVRVPARLRYFVSSCVTIATQIPPVLVVCRIGFRSSWSSWWHKNYDLALLGTRARACLVCLACRACGVLRDKLTLSV